MADASTENPKARSAPVLDSLPSRSIFWIVLLIAGAACLAITNRSFWIDECFSAEFAMQPTLAGCWQAMKLAPEVQLPLYMLYLWGSAHLFGMGEWILRFIGLPWFLAGATIFSVALGRVLGSMLVPALLISWSAFAWYYLNEARVYSIQLGFALALVGSGVSLLQTISSGEPSRRALRLFLLSLFLLCGTSVLGAMWGFFLFIACLVLVRRSEWPRLLRLAPWSVTACGFGLMLLAGYYAWTMTLHAKPTSVGTTTPQTVVFVFYELIGAAGWGPGRNDLRGAGAGALKPFLPALGLFAALSAVVCWQGVKELVAKFGLRRVVTVAVLVVVPFVLLCTMGVATRFRVLGRHATPLMPLLLLVLSFGFMRLLRPRRFTGRLIATLFLLCCLGSSLLMRFAARHEKDDYRSAAAIAKAAAAAGKSVWWVADGSGAAYYHIFDDPHHERVMAFANQTQEFLQALAKPDVVILSKPDVYDRTGATVAYLRQHGYQVTAAPSAFKVWTRTP